MTQALTNAAFAIPGDIATRTGGYIYERRLLEGLRDLGHDVAHIQLAPTFPGQSDAEMADAIERMAAVPPDQPLIVDGLVFGAADGLDTLRAPMVAMIHHPLALEEGLSTAEAEHLFQTERRNVALARRILVPSAHTREILIARYGARADLITVAPPGVDRPTAPRAPTSPPLILTVGILHPRKGHDVLLDALARLKALSWRAVIVGRVHDQAHASALRAQAEAVGLADRVTFAGEVTSEELSRLYAEATLFALATRYEGYGMVFAEALAQGLPIVATDGGAVPDTVPSAAGLHAPVGDAAAFASAVEAVLMDSATRDSLTNGAIQAGAALPSWDDTARIASRVLQSVGQIAVK